MLTRLGNCWVTINHGDRIEEENIVRSKPGLECLVLCVGLKEWNLGSLGHWCRRLIGLLLWLLLSVYSYLIVWLLTVEIR